MPSRIEDFARAIISHQITPEDVPYFERDAVQEQILTWYLEQRPPRQKLPALKRVAS